MATIIENRVRGRPAHTNGPTHCTYTPDGSKLVTAGGNNTIRIYATGSDGEPTNIDDGMEDNFAITAANDFFITGSEDGNVSYFSLRKNAFDRFITRCTLPVRDVQLSPDKEWVAVASDELTVKIINVTDVSRTMSLNQQGKPTKHLSYHPSGKYIALSCTDGVVYVYKVSVEEPELVGEVDGVIRPVDTDSEVSSKIAWHPAGTAFVAPTATRDIKIVSTGDWKIHGAYADGHTGDITAVAWSPNGAILATAGKDRKVLLWDNKTRQVIAKHELANVMDIAWHPTRNILSFTNTEGEVYIHNDFVPEEHAGLLDLELQAAPITAGGGQLAPISGNQQRLNGNLQRLPQRPRAGTPDSVDDALGSILDDDDFIIDDDGAGYVEGGINGNGKRVGSVDVFDDYPGSKRVAGLWQPQIHEAFQPGSTPWQGDRKYLCLNLLGFIWTIEQEGAGSYHTVTVEFYDREFQRDFHFTDTYLYDRACLSAHGALFSAPPNPQTGSDAVIFYRPHDTWTERGDWRTTLPKGESVTAMSLSDSFITVLTSAGYVRIFTLYLTPYRIYRQKASPTVTCASWRDYVLTVGNGPVGADGTTTLLYSIENVKRDEVCQNNDIVALPPSAELKSVFFSDAGDPCIYDSTGTLLTLLHWRSAGQAKWVPLLDTRQLARLASGRKTESYWPVAVADGRFHCIILKGKERYPYFPRPMLSDFAFQLPLSSRLANVDSDDAATASNADRPNNDREVLEEEWVRNSVLSSLLQDLVESTKATYMQKRQLERMDVEGDKMLLKMLNMEMMEGEERGMKCLSLVKLLRDANGKMVEAAGKLAERHQRGVLGEKIREVGERRLLGMDGEEEGGMDEDF